MNKVLVFGLGVIIGAGGMWFMQKSSVKTLQVDEVIESYGTPMTTEGQNGQPAGNQPMNNNQTEPKTTGSLEQPITLSDAGVGAGVGVGNPDGMGVGVGAGMEMGNNPNNGAQQMPNNENNNNQDGNTNNEGASENQDMQSQGGY